MKSLDFTGLKKAELHAHLNGCVPPEVIAALVRRHDVVLPEGFILPNDLTILSPVASLIEYFRPWNVFKRLPIGKECLDEMVNGAVRALVDDGVVYAELRNSPYNIAEINGVPLEEGLLWLSDAAECASIQFGIDVRLIISFSRYQFQIERAQTLLTAIENVNHARRIVGLDLSGNETDPIDKDVARLFRHAKDEMGLGITIHAGETTGPENIKWAIEECKADRIGHGLTLVSDPELAELAVKRETCIEVCLTSNFLTGRFAQLDAHPVRTFIELGIPFVLCSDNPAVHRTPLSGEYQQFIDLTGRRDIIDGMFDRQMRHAFK